ncbi:conserved exported hypothetical protein [Bradyrhizobium sp. ORS 375]|uniref:hypothetical protein n=1 Tax=Bradyrhizobium sp. (strain ORS 375) TaxID=566679 RepID=UPI000240A184|nr:hypothetical protein [Bradyrhizobium sp. ORS 375]CCD92833.1 conserved exported hypothetical protein [Bradyrhizobium sp. ORS 375]
MNRALIVAIVSLLALAPFAAAWAGCVPDQRQSFICGDGKDAIRVFSETTSPSGKLAFGWRTSAGLPTGQAEPAGDVENVLVRLQDGAVLGRLGGTYWATGKMRANRYDLVAAWSPDSRAVVEVANSRWDTDSFRFYAVGNADSVTLDLHDLVERAVRAKSQPQAAKGRVFRIREDLPVKLDGDGRLSFAAILFIPKSEEPALGFRVELMIKTIKSSAAARVISVQRAKLSD